MKQISWIDIDRAIFDRIVMWKSIDCDSKEFIQRLEELLWLKKEAERLAKEPEAA